MRIKKTSVNADAVIEGIISPPLCILVQLIEREQRNDNLDLCSLESYNTKAFNRFN